MDVKNSLNMRQVAEFYGFMINQSGFCACPFHNDNHPSMKIFNNNKGFYCFVCGAGGDLITFMSRYFNLANEEACFQLIEDFSLHDPRTEVSFREKREREKRIRDRHKLEYFRKSAYAALHVYWQLLCEAIQNPKDRHFVEACQELTIVEYRLDCLAQHPEEYYADKKAVKQIERIRNRVINWYGSASEERTNTG